MRNFLDLGQEVVLFRTGKSTLPDDGLQGLPIERDLSIALDRWGPDGVVVANPTSLHLDVALPAAKAGCNVLIEKPVSHNMAGLAELDETLSARGRKALVGYHFRFHPGLKAVKGTLEEGRLGTPVSASVHWGEYLPGWHPWEDYRCSYAAREDLGGGVLLTLSHPFDYLRWFFGDVKSVSAQISCSGLGLQVEDTAEILLEFAAGLLGRVHLNYNQRPPQHTLQIVCTGGTIEWNYFNGMTQVWPAVLDSPERVDLPRGFDRNDMFVAEAEHFLAVVAGDVEPVCALKDGVHALEIALAARESAMSGHRIMCDAGERLHAGTARGAKNG